MVRRPLVKGPLRLQVEDAEAQRLSPEDVGESSAPGMGPQQRWSGKFPDRRDTSSLVPVIKGEQVTLGAMSADRGAEDDNSRKRSTPSTLRLLTRSSPDRGVFGSS